MENVVSGEVVAQGEPHYDDGIVSVYFGDCLDVLPTLPANSVHAVCTDPPYELSFMGKAWDASGVAFNPAVWTECLRVLKPGGHLLAFGGTRTVHRMACAIEDAGFEIRDQIVWLYGSGFPKSLDVSKAIDKAAGAEREVVGKGINYDAKVKHAETHSPDGGVTYLSAPTGPHITAPATDAARRWQGWGTALKPANEPIVVARKPLRGIVAANVQRHGTGALNVDACRIGTDERVNLPAGNKAGGNSLNMSVVGMPDDAEARIAQGRWPANVIVDETAVADLNEQSGTSKSQGGRAPSTGAFGKHGVYRPEGRPATGDLDAPPPGYGDTGGASRFFYVAKANKRDRGEGNTHPTVKPVELMRYLLRLITPPGGVVLDPFFGTGTTGEAAILEGFRCIGIERDPGYLEEIKARMDRPTQIGLELDYNPPSVEHQSAATPNDLFELKRRAPYRPIKNVRTGGLL